MDHVHAAWEVPSSLLPSIIHMVTQCSVLSMLLLLNYACRKKTLCCLRLCYSPSKKSSLCSMSSSSVYSKCTAGFDSSAITQCCFYLALNVGVPACHISSEDRCSKIA